MARIRDGIREAASSKLAGLYLFGSLAVGYFDVDASDIHVVEGGPDWVLNWYPARASAVALLGPPVETFIPPISREAFELAVRQHLRRFPDRVRDGDSLPAHAYAILTMCRGWYTLCVGDQPSKTVAAAWAQRELPQWAPLIRAALAWRKGEASAGGSGARDVHRFVTEIAHRANV